MADNILVIAEARGDRLAGVTLESISHGRGLAAALGGRLSVLVGGGRHRATGRRGGTLRRPARVRRREPGAATYRPGPFTDAAAAAVKAEQPAAVLFSGSAEGRDVASACAARFGAGCLVDATGLELVDGGFVATHPCFGGNVIASMQVTAGPTVVAVRPSSFAREEAPAEPEVVPLAVDFGPASLLTTIADVVCENAGIVSLEEAAIIVSGGRGVGSAEGFAVVEQLADAIGAAVGASRAVVDAGWKHHQYQVGQTGKTVSPTAVHRRRPLRLDPAPRRHAELAAHRRHQQGPGGAHLLHRRLRRGRRPVHRPACAHRRADTAQGRVLTAE